jgi:hypothetical protein
MKPRRTKTYNKKYFEQKIKRFCPKSIFCSWNSEAGHWFVTKGTLSYSQHSTIRTIRERNYSTIRKKK